MLQTFASLQPRFAPPKLSTRLGHKSFWASMPGMGVSPVQEAQHAQKGHAKSASARAEAEARKCCRQVGNLTLREGELMVRSTARGRPALWGRPAPAVGSVHRCAAPGRDCLRLRCRQHKAGLHTIHPN